VKPEQQAALREPFPRSAVGKLPKGGQQLDYVGHAAVTDRLLAVDPAWTWEPVALDAMGLPAYDQKGGLWIRLTVAGVTRLGYGDGPDPKQRIGDAIRNAAMRFGVALDLWSKEEVSNTTRPTRVDPDTGLLGGDIQPSRFGQSFHDGGDRQRRNGRLRALAGERKWDADRTREFAAGIVGRPLASSKELTTDELLTVADALAREPKDGAA
jgi:hypothetical protein